MMNIYPVLFTHDARIKEAIEFCKAAHGEQKRKYTGEPYYTHCFEVASLVLLAGGNSDMVMAALLHDVLEDTETTCSELLYHFGDAVASAVMVLTDHPYIEGGPNRAERKRLDRERLAKADFWVTVIKCADIISNTGTIVKHDPDFAKVYLPEIKELLSVLPKSIMHSIASAMLDTAFFSLIGYDERKAEILKGNYALFKRRAETYDKQADREEAEKDAQAAADAYKALTGKDVFDYNQ
jgi:(p)ppGpp synthase/HD superfamily hydrolase